MSHDIKNILFLGDKKSPLLEWLKNKEESIIQTPDKIDPYFIKYHHIDFLISYGYRHIISEAILQLLPSKAINLHISYLPWNRGADPNLWSFIDNTPKGVTIHYIDEGIDTGDIIVQQEIRFDVEKETLATSYAKLQIVIQGLFKKSWNNIKLGKVRRIKQAGRGSYHQLKDRELFLNLLIEGWDTPIKEIIQ